MLTQPQEHQFIQIKTTREVFGVYNKNLFDYNRHYIEKGYVAQTTAFHPDRPTIIGIYTTIEEAIRNARRDYNRKLHQIYNGPDLYQWAETRSQLEPTPEEIQRYEEWRAWKVLLECNGDNLYFDTFEIQMRHIGR